MMQISCVICAYNEAPRIGAVLDVVINHPLLHEIVVVDDGSTDGTAEAVKAFPSVRLISHTKNRGKSIAMATGIAASRNDLLMLIDADLKGLTTENITALADPVLAGLADVSLSLRKNSLLLFRLIGLDFVSGERVVKKDILSEVLHDMHGLPRFGIEVFMNQRIISRKLSISVIRWAHVTQSRKTEKMGYWKGMRAEWRMLVDVMNVSFPFAAITQTFHMLLLRTRNKVKSS